jgi:hypothetical protein
MSRKITLNATQLGSELTLMDIYHTEVTGSNLLTSSISTAQLTAGITLTAPDDATLFIAQCTSGKCNELTGSVEIPVYSQSTRYFTVNSDGNGTVSITTPVSAGPTTGTLSQSVNFNVYPLFTITAAATYPFTFQGWYTAAIGGILLTTNSTLSVTLDTVTLTDDFYARFI